MRADGSGLRRMTDAEDKSGKETPVWTMDGGHLIYVSNLNDPRTWQVYIVGGGDPSQLTYGTGNKSAPVVSPDGKQVAFITQGAIKTMLTNGKDVFQLMPVPTAGEGAGEEGGGRPNMDAATSIRGPFRTAALSSDGSGCAGVKELSGEDSTESAAISLGNQASFVIPPGGDRSLILDTGREVDVDWEPNGKRLASAFSGLQDRGTSQKNLPASGIVLWDFANPQKPQPQPVFIAAAHTVEPRNVAWSPDGSKLAFEVWRVKGEEDRQLLGIVVMAVSKNSGIRIDNAPQAEQLRQRTMVKATPDARPQRPLWSPDGTRLLYEVTRKDGKHDLWIINADGTDPLNLTNGAKDGTDNVQASWSPRRK
jgi:TolB protein